MIHTGFSDLNNVNKGNTVVTIPCKWSFILKSGGFHMKTDDFYEIW